MSATLELRQLTECLIYGDQHAAARAEARLTRLGWASVAQISEARRAGEEIRAFVERGEAMRRAEVGLPGLDRDAEQLAARFPSWTALILCLPLSIKSGSFAGSKAPNRIANLPASASWHIAIDEVGVDFAPTARPYDRGKVVGVVWRDEQEPRFLPPRWHAVGANTSQRERALRAIASGPTGVMGLSSDQIEAADDGWVASVVALLGWVALLLPLPDKGRARLRAAIEQRAQYKAGADWSLVERLIQMRLAKVDPERARRLSIQIRGCGKGEPGLGLADVLAHAWGGPKPIGSEHLRSYGLNATLYERPSHDLGRVWSTLDRDRRLDAEEWRWLLSLPSSPGDPVDRARALVENRLREEPRTWRRALRASLAHLESKSLNMPAALREAEVLNKSRPADLDLPPPLQLAEKVGALSRFNHLGGDPSFSDEALEGEIASLSAQIVGENPELVCLADLHRAVQHFNRCDVDRARRALSRWTSAQSERIGAQLQGRVLSSQGQHSASGGRPQDAIQSFDAALDCFASMTEPGIARGERACTSCTR